MMALLGCGGLVLMALLVMRQDAGAVLDVVFAMGPGVIAIVLIHAFQLACAGCAWRFALGGDRAPGAGTMTLIRWIRESVNTLLPSAQVGGDIAGMRLLSRTRGGPGGGRAIAGTVVDLTVEFATLFPFALAGLTLLLLRGKDSATLTWLVVGTLAVLPMAAAFVLVQRRGAIRLLENALAWLAQRFRTAGSGDGTLDIERSLHDIYGAPRALFAAGAWHLAAWCAGVAEVWLILRLAGIPAGFDTAWILESLGQLIRSTAFMIPGALGVQEGGFLLLGTLLGLGPDTSLGLSLAKRAREAIMGVPGLLAWHFLEARQAQSRAQLADSATPPG